MSVLCDRNISDMIQKGMIDFDRSETDWVKNLLASAVDVRKLGWTMGQDSLVAQMVKHLPAMRETLYPQIGRAHV